LTKRKTSRVRKGKRHVGRKARGKYFKKISCCHPSEEIPDSRKNSLKGKMENWKIGGEGPNSSVGAKVMQQPDLGGRFPLGGGGGGAKWGYLKTSGTAGR